MTYYAVIDTNVIVSSLLKHNSTPAMIVELIFTKTIIPLLNEEILQEYHEVLTRNKFGFDENDINAFLDRLRLNSIFLEREKTFEEFADKDDIVFYEIVMCARQTMDAYLITGNIKHFPIRNYVVTPKQMLDLIECNNIS